MISYQMKQKELEKLQATLELIMYAEKRQYIQRDWLKSCGFMWYEQSEKQKHKIEITDMAIKRLKAYYNNQLQILKPLL